MKNQKTNSENKTFNNKLVKNQIELMNNIRQLASTNLVNCGNCGCVLLHDIKDEEISCPYCEHKSDPCDFPDFIYDGMIKIECNDIDGTTLYVSDKVVVLDTEDLDGDVPQKGQVLTVSKLVDAESNYIEFNQGRYAFFGHRVLRLK